MNAGTKRRAPSECCVSAVRGKATLERDKMARCQRERSFDYLGRAGEEHRWHGDAEHLRGLEVDDQLILCRRLHRQVARLLALEDAIDVSGGAPMLVDPITTIGD